jgi:outer membrane protein OmpA-like peptidoglycan-associated protein/tetratricopeptide (TPR) repeat protein
MKIFLKSASLLLIMLLFTGNIFSQKGKVAKANKNFDKYSYIDAREVYLKVVEDGYKSAEIYKRLGDTYYYNSEYKSASKWYSNLMSEFPDDIEPKYYYRGAQSLKSSGEYEKSDNIMKLYYDNGGSTIVAKNFSENPGYLHSIAENARDFSIEKTTINSNLSDFGPSFYGNKIVFASSQKNEGEKILSWNGLPFLDLYQADMDDEGNLSNVTGLSGDINTKYNESSTAITKDGKTLYFTRNNFTEGKKGRDSKKTIRLKLYKATKSGDNLWTNVVELPFNGAEFSVAHPALNNDENRLYFASDMEGTYGQSDLWYVDVSGGDSYGTPVNLGATINTEERDTFPFISDKNKLYFSSDGHAGLGGLDVFVSELNEDGSVLDSITNLGEPTNSVYDDFGFIINEEKRIGYISSNRSGDKGSIDDEIYLIKEKKCVISIEGVVTDIDTGALLPGAVVSLMDEELNLVDSTIVGEDATYNFNVDCDKQYTLRVVKTEYTPEEEAVKTPNKTGSIAVPFRLKLIGCPPEDLGCRLTLEPIYFDYDRFNIRPDAEIELAKILAAMREYTELIIHIESHTDSRAEDLYNELLSEKRAQSTLNWLVDQGIDRSRLSAQGYGETQLVNGCTNEVECTEEEHQLNRRSMFIIQN